MLRRLSRLWKSEPAYPDEAVEPARPSGPSGHRAYVVGDVHGRLDLLDLLLEKIHLDLGKAWGTNAVLVFVGDLIDRGPASAGVVERLRTYKRPGVKPIFLLGNHEEVLLRILDGDVSLVSSWLKFGGAQCLQSYGVDPNGLEQQAPAEAMATIRAAIPAKHARFLHGFSDTFRFGDYLFVHAGVRPDVELTQQVQNDLRWIREPFLGHDGDFGFVVVHGHTISECVEERPNRIGIDTGAYMSGLLSALVIDGEDRWILDTSEAVEARS